MDHAGIASGCTGCIDIGVQYFWADVGDTLELSYDVELHKGQLQMWITRMTPGNLGDVESRTQVVSSGAGVWKARITRRGWYHLVIQGSIGAYDIGYSIHWRIQR